MKQKQTKYYNTIEMKGDEMLLQQQQHKNKTIWILYIMQRLN